MENNKKDTHKADVSEMSELEGLKDQVNALKSPDKYMSIRKKIKQAFHDNRDCYGYRRIHSIMKNDGTVISEKSRSPSDGGESCRNIEEEAEIQLI